MKPLELSARFAAFVWYTNHRQAPAQTTQAEARQFANESWRAFLPVAQEGLGKLLLRIANVRPARQRLSMSAKRPCNKRVAAAVA